MFDEITLKRIELMHPLLREQLSKDYLQINRQLPKGVRLRFTHTFRTIDEQNELFNQKPKVTNAKGGQSLHNYGMAFDICILLDENNDGKFEKAVWKGKYFDAVVSFFKAKGWEWGGDWIKFKDEPHFQMKKIDGKSYNWKELINLPKKGNYPLI